MDPIKVSDEFCGLSMELNEQSEALKAMMVDLRDLYAENQKRRRELWDAMTEEYDLDRDVEYSLNPRLGLISEKR